MKLRPSSLPMLAQCPAFESDAAHNEAERDAGTARHRMVADFLTHGEFLFDETEVSDDEADKVRWASDYIRQNAPLTEYSLRVEVKRTLWDDAFDVIMTGTPDVTCGPNLFDLKSRPRDYSLQMAAYALMMFQENAEWQEIQVHLLFSELGGGKPYSYVLSRASAGLMVFELLGKLDGTRTPRACEYCGWCAHTLTCPAVAKPALEVAGARGAEAKDVELFQRFLSDGAHPSMVDDPAIMGAALRVARIVKKFAESAEHRAREMAKLGLPPHGFTIRARKGKVYVSDVAEAFRVSTLPQDEFLRACSVRLETSMTYPDQVGVIDIYKKFHGFEQKAPAKRALLERMQAALKQTPNSIQLIAQGESEEDAE